MKVNTLDDLNVERIKPLIKIADLIQHHTSDSADGDFG